MRTIGKNLITLNNTDSTNNYAEKLINEAKPPDGTVIVSKLQTSGKGYAKNKWFSGDNQNLTFTIILKPLFLPVEKQFIIHKIISLTIIDTLIKYIPDRTLLKIKWPNDIYYKKFKLAGVLTENKIIGNQIDYSIIGVGININQEIFPKELPNPISLFQVINQQINLETFLDEFCNILDDKYEKIKSDLDFFSEDYLNNLFQRNEYKKYFANNKEFEGKIIGIDEFGFLQIKDNENNTQQFDFKEIKYIFNDKH